MPSSPLRIIFAGTPEFAASHLAALLAAGHHVIAVYTQPDRPAGRGKKLQPSPVKKLAASHRIEVYQPHTLKNESEQARLAALDADLMIVVAYGLILPQPVLDAPRHGCLNVHASLLPRWRGAAPIQRAIEAGDRETGVTIMQMDAGLDTGDMLATWRCPIEPDMTAASLHDTLAQGAQPLLLDVLADLPRYQGEATRQDEKGATYADKILKAEAEIDWQVEAGTLDRRVRAFNPFPVCFSTLGDERVKIWEATAKDSQSNQPEPGTILSADRNGICVACGRGQLNIRRLQLPGGKPLTAEQLLNAKSELFTPGRRLGSG